VPRNWVSRTVKSSTILTGAVRMQPKKNEKMVGDWLILHDPEKYTYDNYYKAAEHLLTGAPFENTNIPPGYRYKPWTVRELLAASDHGEVVEDEGVWF